MTFDSLFFLVFFLPVGYLLYSLTPDRWKNCLLTVLSFVFYAWGEPDHIILLICSVSVNFGFGLLFEKVSDRKKRFWLACGIILNLGILILYKYWNLGVNLINSVMPNEIISLHKTVLPIGISFYTFRNISYLADLYRGTVPVQKSWIDYALYCSFFPCVSAGPIEKYADFSAQLRSRTVSADQSEEAVYRLCSGLAKKTVIANVLGNVVDRLYALPIEEMSTSMAWAAAGLYMLQIYYDFSGYSDMAIGLASLFGFRPKENFLYPYTALSVRDFWRRWHISLSSWFREYVYIPLGGNRKGTLRTSLNLAVVFLLTGLWHGSGFHFLFWGIFHGAFSIIEQLLERSLPDRIRKKTDQSWIRVLHYIYTMLEVMIGWIFFRVPGFRSSLTYIRMLFDFCPESVWSVKEFINPSVGFVLVLALLFLGWPQRFISGKFPDFFKNSRWRIPVSLFLLLISILQMVNSTGRSFIYFRF